MKKKKKKIAKIVDKSSVNYTFNDNKPAYNLLIGDQNTGSDQNPKDLRKLSVSDIKNQNRHKATSKKIKTLQGHSPVYE